MLPVLGTLVAALSASGCSNWFLSGVPYPDRTRPVVRIETRGGVEYGAATELGVLFLGRSAKRGPCRVHYFLGEQLLVDDGEIEAFGGVFWRAELGRRHSAARLWTSPVGPGDELIAIVIDGGRAVDVPVRVAQLEGVHGDVLGVPPRALPAGTPLFVAKDDQMCFVGLVSAEASVSVPGQLERRYVLFAGIDALRRALELPENDRADVRIEYRPDGTWREHRQRREAPAEPIPTGPVPTTPIPEPGRRVG